MHLKNIRQYRNMTLDELSKLSDTSKGNLSLIENGKINLKLEKGLKIAKILNCRPSDLTGETTFDPEKIEDDLITIPSFTNIISERYSNDLLNIKNARMLEFNKTLLEHLGVEGNYNKVFFTRMIGDTMQPFIAHDDTLLVSRDISIENVQSSKIYIVREYERLQVKRIMRKTPFTNMITIKNDNEFSQNYQSYDIDIQDLPDNFFIGRVIYVGKRLY